MRKKNSPLVLFDSFKFFITSKKVYHPTFNSKLNCRTPALKIRDQEGTKSFGTRASPCAISATVRGLSIPRLILSFFFFFFFLSFFPKSIYKARRALLTPCTRWDFQGGGGRKRRPGSRRKKGVSGVRNGGGGKGGGGTNIGTSTAKSTRGFERAGCLIRSQRRQPGSAEEREEAAGGGGKRGIRGAQV